jgi:hypothetical protein
MTHRGPADMSNGSIFSNIFLFCHDMYYIAQAPTVAALASSRAAATSIFGQLGGVKLKKTETVEKTMFKKTEGNTAAGAAATVASGDKRIALSKLVDFPGDYDEVKKHLQNLEKIDPAGRYVFCSVLPSVMYCLVLCIAWCSVLPGVMYCLVFCI